MRRNALVALLLLAAAPLVGGGCSKPFRVITKSCVTVEPSPSVRVEPLCEMPLRGYPDDGTKVVLIDVDGLLLNEDLTGLFAAGENPVSVFREKLDHVAADPCVRAVVLRINSYGGGVTASDIMLHDLLRFKACTGLPVVACLMDVAAGGAYLLATGADQIVAHPTTITGGVGVILNIYNLQDAMAQFNVVGIPIKSGEHIDLGSPIATLSPEARELLQTMSDQFHQRFRELVINSRPLRDSGPEQLDGRVFTASQALETGFVDEIGYLDDAIQLARSAGGSDQSRVVILHRAKDRARTAYDMTANVPLQATLLPISIPGLDRSRLPTFLYLWQPEPTQEKLGGK